VGAVGGQAQHHHVAGPDPGGPQPGRHLVGALVERGVGQPRPVGVYEGAAIAEADGGRPHGRGQRHAGTVPLAPMGVDATAPDGPSAPIACQPRTGQRHDRKVTDLRWAPPTRADDAEWAGLLAAIEAADGFGEAYGPEELDAE